uniref:Uncharacterized protein n=1 Tax=Cacopsylla melanoneura TaxID=428564 RepID=A0A8D8QKT1_9HEMI
MGSNNEELLKSIENMMNTKLDDMEKNINKNTDTQIGNLSNQIAHLSKENEATKEKVNTHETRIESLEKQNKSKESMERNGNIIMYGIKEENYGNARSKVVEILKFLDPEINRFCVKGMFKLGKGGWNAEGPIKVILISPMVKNDIMRLKHKLKVSEIRITEDLSPEARETRKSLAQYSLAEKDKGNKVFMRGETLVINGKAWTLEQLEETSNAMLVDSLAQAPPIPPTSKDNEKPKVGNLKRSNKEISPPLHSPLANKKNKLFTTPNQLNNQIQLNLQQMWPKEGENSITQNKTNQTNSNITNNVNPV